MSPRKTVKKSERPYPPAPSAEEDATSIENDGRERFSQEAIEGYLAHERMAGLRLDNEEDEYVDDGDSEDTLHTPEIYEHDERVAPRLNRSEPAMREQSCQHVTVEPSQRLTVPVQYFTIPTPPPPTIIIQGDLRNIPAVLPPEPGLDPEYRYVGRIPGAFGQPHRPFVYPNVPYTGDYSRDRYLNSLRPDGKSRLNMHAYRPTPTANRVHDRPSEWIPPMLPRSADRALALRMEPVEVFEAWAQSFGISGRMETDLALLRENIDTLYRYYYRP